jgi:hypothetical protein
MEEAEKKYFIEVLQGVDRGRVIAIEPCRIPIGRQFAPGEEKPRWLLFSDPSVERMHAIMAWDPGLALYLFINKDPGNRSLVNGEFADESYIYPGDVIQLGTLVMRLLDAPPPDRMCETIPGEPEEQREESPSISSLAKAAFTTTREQESDATEEPEPPEPPEPRFKLPFFSKPREEDDAAIRDRVIRDFWSNLSFIESAKPAAVRHPLEPAVIPAFYLLCTKGKYQGTKISIFSAWLIEGKSFWISHGEPGSKALEFSEQNPGAHLFSLHYSGKSFSFIPSGKVSVKINDLPMTQKVILKMGDSIAFEGIHLIFVEHQILEELARWEFIVMKGNDEDIGKRFNITRELVSIGRAKPSDIRLTDNEIALHHGTIHYFMNRFYYTHRSHKHITYFYETPVKTGKQRLLTPGDTIIQSSKTHLLFRKKVVPGELYESFEE